MSQREYVETLNAMYDLSRLSKSNSTKKIEEYIKYLVSLSEQYTDERWSGNDKNNVLAMCYLAFRYNSLCSIKSIVPESYYLKYQTGKNILQDLKLQMSAMNNPFLFYNDILSNFGIVNNIVKCIKKNPTKSFPILLNINNVHANMLIYNGSRKLGRIEHFEPHGRWRTDLKVDVESQINELIQYINETYFNNSQIEYVPFYDTCPIGNTLQIAKGDTYCAAWSFMIAELHLKFANLDMHTIQNIIHETLNDIGIKQIIGKGLNNLTIDDIFRANLDLIHGYIVDLNNNINAFLGPAIVQNLDYKRKPDVDVLVRAMQIGAFIGHLNKKDQKRIINAQRHIHRQNKSTKITTSSVPIATKSKTKSKKLKTI